MLQLWHQIVVVWRRVDLRLPLSQCPVLSAMWLQRGDQLDVQQAMENLRKGAAVYLYLYPLTEKNPLERARAEYSAWLAAREKRNTRCDIDEL